MDRLCCFGNVAGNHSRLQIFTHRKCSIYFISTYFNCPSAGTFFGEITLGAQSRFDLGFFSLQPSDPAKLVLIIILAKYFAKRHEDIANFKHILVSGFYAVGIFGLVFIQPDFGSAAILF